VIVENTGSLPQLADSILQGQAADAQLEGFFIPALIGAGSLILGGGTLWHFHERHTEKTDYQECLEKYTAAPFSMDPEKAALVCAGEVKAEGFKFGLNAPTFVLVAGSVFGLWFMTQLMISAARK